MEAIFSSKLYKTIRSKDKIASALVDPINTELVQQLREYLTVDPAVYDDSTISVPTAISSVPEATPNTALNSKPSQQPTARPSTYKSTTPPTSETSTSDELEPFDDSSSELDLNSTVPSTSETTTDSAGVPDELIEPPSKSRAFHTTKQPLDNDNQEVETVVEQSVNTSGSSVQASSNTANKCCSKFNVDAAAIKGTLNVRADTAGVSRIFMKDNELWIYYQDKINLNSVMEPVISVLNSTGFTNLEFNRLARTDNAIVFEISCIYDEIQPISSEE